MLFLFSLSSEWDLRSVKYFFLFDSYTRTCIDPHQIWWYMQNETVNWPQNQQKIVHLRLKNKGSCFQPSWFLQRSVSAQRNMHFINVCEYLCLFVWILSSHSRICRSYIWRCHHCRWRAANFDLCSALSIEQWGFFNVPHPLQHGPTVYNGHLRGPVTLTPVAERLAVKLSLPVLTT